MSLMSPGVRRVRVAFITVVLMSSGLLVSSGSARAATGDITEYPIPTSNSQPKGITAGPDGNLWFTESNGNKVAKVTTAGVVTEYALPTAGADPRGIVAGPDGNLWFTEFNVNKVAKVTTAGAFTEYTITTPTSGPYGITTGPDGNLWFIENSSNKVAKVTTSGVFTEYPIPTTNSFAISIAAGPDGNLWFTEANPNHIGKVTPAGVFTEYTPASSDAPADITAGPGGLWFTEFSNRVGRVTTAGVFTEFAASSTPYYIATGPDGNLWYTEVTANKVVRLTPAGVTTEYATPTSSSGPYGIAPGPGDGNMWFTEYVVSKVAKVATTSASCPVATSAPATLRAASLYQYVLGNSDGVNYSEIDPHNLRLDCKATVNQSVLLTANADLFTADAGFNQDLGIFVSDNEGAYQLLAWKESGGFAGIFSPNAAYVQVLFNMQSGHTYVFTLGLKANKSTVGNGVRTFVGAGPISGAFSPTTLIAEILPSGFAPSFAVTNKQYTLANSDGSTWQPIDAALDSPLSPVATGTAVLGANVDLWTANAGFNQDIGIFVSDNGGADSLVAWKESGGFAGTFSPNAAFVKATYPVAIGHAYTFKLKWKTNKNAAGATIVAAAGSTGAFSPTSLMTSYIASGANPYSAVSTSQYHLSNSDGATWQPIDVALNVTVTPAADTNSILGANVDLWTANAGFNQDIAIFVSDNGGADQLVAWKESGGFAGTFSPNAAFAQYTYRMISGHTYVFKLKWKTNINAPGATIFAAAGGPAPYSPTRLTVEVTG
jgi:virginiamycin B lyase